MQSNYITVSKLQNQGRSRPKLAELSETETGDEATTERDNSGKP